MDGFARLQKKTLNDLLKNNTWLVVSTPEQNIGQLG
jgi:hypothetical protein